MIVSFGIIEIAVFKFIIVNVKKLPIDNNEDNFNMVFVDTFLMKSMRAQKLILVC
jgi:hypothetical protein